MNLCPRTARDLTSQRVSRRQGWAVVLATVALTTFSPAGAFGKGGHGGGGHAGGGHGGGGHSGGHSGGSFYSGGGSYHGGSVRSGGGTMHVSPSHVGNVHAPVTTPHTNLSAIHSSSGTANSSGGASNSDGSAAVKSTARHAMSSNTISSSRLKTVNTNLNAAVKPSVAANHSPHNWQQNSPERAAALATRGDNIRTHFTSANSQCFHKGWWTGRHVSGWGIGGYGGWFGYQPWLGISPWWYWWGAPGWNACCAWFPYGWNQGCYYDYGPNGNVVYQNGQVLVNGQPVGTDAEYAQSGAELAAVDPNAAAATPDDGWLPLGTFSMAVTENEVDPARVIQLAVNKEGIVSGTIHNRSSGNTYTVQGRVDKETQRVAFTIGSDRDTVIETGIYNLTQDQTPVLCHFGTSTTQVYLFARLPEPEHEKPAGSTASPAAPSDVPPPPPPPEPAVPANPTATEE